MKFKVKLKLPHIPKLKLPRLLEFNLRRKYQLRALFSPGCWFRNERTNKVFDEWLWNALNEDQPVVISGYHCVIKGRKIWIENYPYASGRLDEIGKPPFYCSRATTLRLHDSIAEAFFWRILEAEDSLEQNRERLLDLYEELDAVNQRIVNIRSRADVLAKQLKELSKKNEESSSL